MAVIRYPVNASFRYQGTKKNESDPNGVTNLAWNISNLLVAQCNIKQFEVGHAIIIEDAHVTISQIANLATWGKLIMLPGYQSLFVSVCFSGATGRGKDNTFYWPLLNKRFLLACMLKHDAHQYLSTWGTQYCNCCECYSFQKNPIDPPPCNFLSFFLNYI